MSTKELTVFGPTTQPTSQILKGSHPLDSLDARALQCHYALFKLEALIKYIKALRIKIRSLDAPQIILVHYIAVITGPLLNVSNTLSERVRELTKLHQVQGSKRVYTPMNAAAVNFEIEDAEEDKEILRYKGVDTHSLLSGLVETYEAAVSVYQMKLNAIKSEKNIQGKSNKTFDLDALQDLFNPIEVEVIPKLLTTEKELSTFHFQKIPQIIDFVKRAISVLKTYIDKLQSYKNKPSDGNLRHLPSWEYTIHRIFTCFLRLSDLYSIIRSLGRKEYLPNFATLHSAKITHHQPKLLQSLSEAEKYFKNARLNQNLVFAVTKISRQGSIFAVQKSTIVELITPLVPSLRIVAKSSDVIYNLTKNWEIAHSAMIVANQSEKHKKLSNGKVPAKKAPELKKLEFGHLFNPEKHKLDQESMARLQRQLEKQAAEDRASKEKQEKERKLLDDAKTKKRVEQRERELRDELKENSPTSSAPNSMRRSHTRTRSNSNGSSCSSNSSTSSSSLNAFSDAISSPIENRSPTYSPSLKRIPATAYAPNQAFDIRCHMRRQSGSSSNSSSNGSSSLSNSAIAQTAATQGHALTRRRSQSLQGAIQQSQNHNNSMVTAAASVAVFNQERHSSLKSKSELAHLQIKEQEKHRSQQSLQGATVASRSPSPLKSVGKTELPRINEHSPTRGSEKTGSTLKGPPKLKISIPEKSSTSTPTPALKSVMKSPSPRTENTKSPPVVTSANSVNLATTNDEDHTTLPIKKVVRFIGVPDEIEEDPVPKRRGWINPPKLSPFQNSTKPRSALSSAADALVQQEQMTFQNIRRGELDVNTGKVVVPNTRLVNQMNAAKNGRWKLSNRLRHGL